MHSTQEEVKWYGLQAQYTSSLTEQLSTTTIIKRATTPTDMNNTYLGSSVPETHHSDSSSVMSV